MGLHDLEEQLDACRADTVTLERELTGARARIAALDAQLEALFAGPGDGTIGTAWAEHRRIWGGPLDDRIRFGAGYQAALVRQPTRMQVTAPELEALGCVILTPAEIDLVAPALLEAGTRHLEQRGTAWHELGTHLHRIAARLYAATNRQEHP